MKQEIERYNNGSVEYITNRNNTGQRHSLSIGYNPDGSILCIRNWFNGKRFGLDTIKYSDGEIYQSYRL